MRRLLPRFCAILGPCGESLISLVGYLSYRSNIHLERNATGDAIANMENRLGTSDVTVDVGVCRMLVCAIWRHSNKELVSVAIWIYNAKADLVVGSVMQFLPGLLEASRLLLRLQHRRRSINDVL